MKSKRGRRGEKVSVTGRREENFIFKERRKDGEMHFADSPEIEQQRRLTHVPADLLPVEKTSKSCIDATTGCRRRSRGLTLLHLHRFLWRYEKSGHSGICQV